MPQAQGLVSKKIRVFALIMTLIGIAAGLSGYIKPDAIVANFMPDTVATHTISMMFAGRNLAMGIAMLLVWLWGVPEHFALIFTIRFMTELADVTALIANAAPLSAVLPMVIFIGIIMILEVSVVVAMMKIIKKRDQTTM